MSDEPKLHVWTTGTREWRLNDQYHRVDGPAVEWQSGSKEWWLNGSLHRVDGPAIEEIDGYKEWWLNGVPYTEEEHYFQVMMRYCDV